MRKQWKDETKDILSQVMLIIKRAKDTRAETLSASIKKWASKNGVKLGMVMAPLRIALIGALKGPDIFAVCAVLGRPNAQLEFWMQLKKCRKFSLYYE